MTDELGARLVRRMRLTAADTQPPEPFIVGVVTSVDGTKARLEENGPGYTIPPGIEVAVGDLVWAYSRSALRLIRENLSRNGLAIDPASTAKYASSGLVTTDALVAAGTSTATVDIETGLTYVPALLIFHEASAGVWRPVPDYVLNSSGQVLDAFRASVEVANTDQTRLIVETQTTRAAGIAATRYRWLILEKQVSA